MQLARLPAARERLPACLPRAGCLPLERVGWLGSCSQHPHCPPLWSTRRCLEMGRRASGARRLLPQPFRAAARSPACSTASPSRRVRLWGGSEGVQGAGATWHRSTAGGARNIPAPHAAPPCAADIEARPFPLLQHYQEGVYKPCAAPLGEIQPSTVSAPGLLLPGAGARGAGALCACTSAPKRARPAEAWLLLTTVATRACHHACIHCCRSCLSTSPAARGTTGIRCR